MKARAVCILCAAMATFAATAGASELSIREYADRIVVELDGSMDPVAARQQVSPAPVRATGPSEEPVTMASARPGLEAPPQGKGDQPTDGIRQDRPYNRSEQVRSYLAQLPDRQELSAGRLEARQVRWNKAHAVKTALP